MVLQNEMLLLKSNNITPKQRWQILVKKPSYKWTGDLLNFTKKKTFKHNTLRGCKAISGVRYFGKVMLYNVFRFRPIYNTMICYAHAYKSESAHDLAFFSTIYSDKLLFLSTPYYRPGFKLNIVSKVFSKINKLAGQIILLNQVPLNFFIRSVFNNTNKYATFALSGGCVAIKRKFYKKSKLTYIELPSTKWKLFPRYTYCTLSKSTPCYSNKVIEGGWGSGIKYRKSIHVRGVAKNPVDHPNGGRTKAKQTELSPWGWIAKRGK